MNLEDAIDRIEQFILAENAKQDTFTEIGLNIFFNFTSKRWEASIDAVMIKNGVYMYSLEDRARKSAGEAIVALAEAIGGIDG